MPKKAVKKIGVLTGGGDCPGLNAVIRAVVKTAVNDYNWKVLGIEDGFDGLIKPEKTRPLSLESVRGILPRGGTILGTTNRGNPFAYKVVEDGKTRVIDLSPKVLENIKGFGLDALVVIGGDGSMRIAYELLQMGAPIVGVPKTIDNDISGTDITFGFDTALGTATDAIDKLHTTAESHHRVMLVEVMGRNAGWIALESGLAGGADVILIPEIPFKTERVCAQIEARSRTGRKFSIIVVAEGARPEGGDVVIQAREESGIVRLGGIGNKVAQEITRMSGHETRVTVLGHVQRGGSPSAFDRILGTRYGAAAVRLVADGCIGQMVALHGARIEAISIADSIRALKTVPTDGELVRTARSLGISFG